MSSISDYAKHDLGSILMDLRSRLRQECECNTLGLKWIPWTGLWVPLEGSELTQRGLLTATAYRCILLYAVIVKVRPRNVHV